MVLMEIITKAIGDRSKTVQINYDEIEPLITEYAKENEITSADIVDTFDYVKRRNEILKASRASGWDTISYRYHLSYEFIREFSNNLDWGS